MVLPRFLGMVPDRTLYRNDGELMRRAEEEVRFYGAHNRLPTVEELDMLVAPTGFNGKVKYPNVGGSRFDRPLTQSQRRAFMKRRPSCADLYLQSLKERFEFDDRMEKMTRSAETLEKMVSEGKNETFEAGPSVNAGRAASSSKVDVVFEGSEKKSASAEPKAELPSLKLTDIT